jgi:hypothetical protein
MFFNGASMIVSFISALFCLEIFYSKNLNGMFGFFFFKKDFYWYLLVFTIFQKQIKFYLTFFNFVLRSQTIKTSFSTLFCLEIHAVNYS